LDLCQAEAVLDVIHATNEEALRIAQKQLQGKLSEKIFQLSDNLLSILAHIESHIDFSDEDIEFNNNIIGMVKNVTDDIANIISTHKYRSALQHGIAVAIVGAPNAGKSSLLNALLRDERALVTDIPGTTRDFISENITIGGYCLRIIDTAGLRETQDVVESLGIQKTIDNIKSADLCLLVEDLSNPNQLSDEIINELSKNICILVKNKIDLIENFYDNQDENFIDDKYKFCRKYVTISAKNNTGIKARMQYSYSVPNTIINHILWQAKLQVLRLTKRYVPECQF
jgi:tRNA modification GTPase